jgi:hypothetical protein
MGGYCCRIVYRSQPKVALQYLAVRIEWCYGSASFQEYCERPG